ncbi:MAG: sulfatase-like hydrolase/transferase [Pirellulales bacterium]
MAGSAAWAGEPPAAKAATRPNILFIFSDDHAQHALSCYGSKVNSTPHLDRLATAGARFTNSFVTNSICTPSRATLLTGQYSHANGVPVFNAFDGSREHVAKHLQRAGYHTGMVGKWHLGTDPTGFDRWIVLPGQGVYWKPSFLVPGGVLSIDGHCTEITGDLGLEFLETRPADKPFFLMLHHKAPHREWAPDECNQAKFKDAVFPEPPTLFDDYATRPTALPSNQQTIARDLTNRDLKREPPAGLGGKERNEWLNTKPDSITVDGATLTGKDAVRWKYQRFMQDYLACVQGVDDSVGRILDYLDRTGLADNTIVIYSTDNGWYLGDLGLYDKRFMYEPGLRVPLLARGPGIKVGITPDAFVANIDLAPTFLDLAGVPVPELMHGRSLAPLLRGETPPDWRKSVYYRYYHDPGHHNTRAHYGVRTATHKLIHYFKQDTYELFDLTADPHEQHNLLFDEAEAKSPPVAGLFVNLKAELEQLQNHYGDDGRYVDPATWPQGQVNGPFPGREPLGVKTVAQAIASSRPAVAKAPAKNPAFTDPAHADDDFPFQGEYAGTLSKGSQAEKYGVQIVALGDGSFDAIGYLGGLPGAGWIPPTKLRGTGKRDGTVLNLEGLDIGGSKRRGRIEGGSLCILDDAGKTIATFPKTERTSPTLGQQPPAGAIVIFDGAGPVDESKTLVNPRLTDDSLLMEGVTTKDSFGDAEWHIEFRLPYQPKDRGQGRGNSGAYVAGAYEVQMLDSFGLEGKNNECGGVYSVAAPQVNMCLPPLAWQTYDIDFTAPRFEGDKKVKDAVMTVRHNGVVIQDHVSVPKITPGGPQKTEGTSGPLHLQNHGNPVRYRTIWVKPKS